MNVYNHKHDRTTFENSVDMYENKHLNSCYTLCVWVPKLRRNADW